MTIMAMGMVMQTRRSTLSGAILFAMLLLPAFVAAQEEPVRNRLVEFSVSHGESDNILMSPGPGRTVSHEGLGLRVDIGADRSRFYGRIVGDLEHQSFSEPVVAGGDDDEVAGSIDGLASFLIVPDRFNWDFSMSTGQVRADPLQPDQVGNRERVTIVATGPSLDLPLGDQTELRLSGRLEERGYQNSPSLDNDATEIEAGLVRELSSVSEIGISYSEIDISVNQSIVDYGNSAVIANYSKEFSTGGVELSVGKGKPKFLGQDLDSITVYRFNWRRDVGSQTTLETWAERELTDPGREFETGAFSGSVDLREEDGSSGDIDISDTRILTGLLTLGPIERETIGLTIRINGQRSRIVFSGGHIGADYVLDDTTDHDDEFLEFFYERELSRQWRAIIDLAVTQQEFAANPVDAEVFDAEISAARRVGQRGNIQLAATRRTRSDGPLSRSQNGLILSYRHAVVR